MIYGQLGQLGQQQANNAAPPPNPSLISDSSRVVDRIRDIHSRVARLSDSLCGPAPTPIAGQTAEKPASEPNIRRNLDYAMNWLSNIESELQRIEAGL